MEDMSIVDSEFMADLQAACDKAELEYKLNSFVYQTGAIPTMEEIDNILAIIEAGERERARIITAADAAWYVVACMSPDAQERFGNSGMSVAEICGMALDQCDPYDLEDEQIYQRYQTFQHCFEILNTERVTEGNADTRAVSKEG